MRGFAVLSTAVHTFGDQLAAVAPGQWDDATPCRGWTVRDLIDHVIEGNNLAVRLLNPTADNGPDVPDDTRLAFERSADRQHAAFARTDPAGSVEHPAGRVTVGAFAVYRAGDITAHAWDLARAIGADELLAAELVDHALVPYVAWVTTLDVEGMFGDGPSSQLAPETTRQDRLLDQLGRRP